MQTETIEDFLEYAVFGDKTDLSFAVHEYGTTQVNLPSTLAREVKVLASKISESELAKHGRESEPHVTVKYGLIKPNADSVVDAIRHSGKAVATIELGPISVFETKDADVVKIEVISPVLRAWNAELSKLPNGDEHPKYEPHVTLAYVKKGEGKKHAGSHGLEGEKFEVSVDDVICRDESNEDVDLEFNNITE